ncbi:MAG: MDR/zinc-dependent alcohol dehydrogenase-like family protein [Chloroflexota bacterium]
MRGVLFDGRLHVSDDIPVPVRRTDEALIRVHRAGICGTDLEVVRGYKGSHGVLGHEFVGTVVEAADEAWVGRRVCGEINVTCGDCAFCRRGLSSHCLQRTVLGILNHPGAFAEFVALPMANLHAVPPAVTDDEAVFAEPLAAAYQILEQVSIQQGDRAVVLGDGRLGILCAQVLKSAGAMVEVVGKHSRKLTVLADRGISVRERTEGLPEQSALVIEATGSASGLVDALALVEPRGTIVLKSTFVGDTPFDLSPAVVNEVTLIGSRCGPFPRALDALARKIIAVTPLIDGCFALAQATDAFALAGTPGVIKILFAVEA